MVIVHVAPNAPYNENWGYQENILPKYQKKLGHDVILIISCKKHDNGKIIDTEEEDRILSDGVRLIRRKQSYIINQTISNIAGYIKIYDLLIELKPDLIFFHGMISYSIMDAVKYKKQSPSCRIVQDNHMDYNIGYSTFTLKKKILRSWYRFLAKISLKYIDKVYGVTPWRKEYAKDYFHVPPDKLDVLIMGADDDKIDFARKIEIRNQIRQKYHIDNDTFLIVTGGKIDKKKKIDILADTCANMKGVALLVFGQIASDCSEQVNRIIDSSDNVFFAGWINGDQVYDFFFAADLVFFPGQHSVLWEQACAAKTPCVFAKWDGMNHVDAGGNCTFIFPITEERIRSEIKSLMFTEKYYRMKEIAESSATDIFLYSNIAIKSIESITVLHNGTK